MASKRSIEKKRNGSLDSQLTAYSAAAEAELALDVGRAKRPNRSIVGYSAAAAGVGLIPALNVDAAIVHNDNGGAGWSLNNTTNKVTFNFDGDGTNDAYLYWGTTGGNNAGWVKEGWVARTFTRYAMNFAANAAISNAAAFVWDNAKDVCMN